MVCCSAPKYSNNSAKGYHLFKFPSDSSRRAVWFQNCRRDKWCSTSISRLYEVSYFAACFPKICINNVIKRARMSITCVILKNHITCIYYKICIQHVTLLPIYAE